MFYGRCWLIRGPIRTSIIDLFLIAQQDGREPEKIYSHLLKIAALQPVLRKPSPSTAEGSEHCSASAVAFLSVGGTQGRCFTLSLSGMTLGRLCGHTGRGISLHVGGYFCTVSSGVFWGQHSLHIWLRRPLWELC